METSRLFIPYGIDSIYYFYDEDNWQLALSDLKNGKSVSFLFHAFGDEAAYFTPIEGFMHIVRDMHAAGVPFKTVGEFFHY